MKKKGLIPNIRGREGPKVDFRSLYCSMSFYRIWKIITLEWKSQSKSYLIASRIERKTHSLLATRSYLVIIFILFSSYKICAEDFSEMARSILSKFSWLMHWHLKLIPANYFLEIHFRSGFIALWSKFGGPPCLWWNSKRLKLESWNF